MNGYGYNRITYANRLRVVSIYVVLRKFWRFFLFVNLLYKKET